MPAVTVGASMSALYAAMLRRQRGEGGGVFAAFWKDWKQNLRHGIACWLMQLAVTAFFAFDFWFSIRYSKSAPGLLGAVEWVSVLGLLAVTLLGSMVYPQIARFENRVRQYWKNAALLLAIVFLSALCASLSVSGACGKVTQMAGTVAVAALSVTHVTSCITAGSEALATLRDFSKILLPSMCAAAAASGAATSAAAKYAATSLFLDVLLSAETAVLLPLLYLYAGTVICGTTLENDVLASLSGLLRKAFRLLLIGFASVFTLYLSLTGILTGSADAAAAKAVKTAVSAALPVVGSIVADAASTVTSSAAILRSGIGVVGVVSVAAMCVTPYLQFVMHYVLYKLAAGIAESFADKRVGRLIDGFADVYGFLLGMVGVASLILFLSIVSSMKAVTG